MLDKMTRKLAEKMGRSVKEVAAPVKEEVQKVATNKIDLWSRLLRFGVLIFLFVDGTRRVVNEPNKSDSSPNQIVINNYVDTKPPYRGNQRQYTNDKKKGG